MSKYDSVRGLVFEVIQNEIDAGRLTKEQLLSPKLWGQCNDYAMFIQAIASHTNTTGYSIREETVLRYVREFKSKLRKRESLSQNNTVKL